MRAEGIGLGHYFSPHLFDQPYFAGTCVAADLAVTNHIAERIVSLPMPDTMTQAEVSAVAMALRRCIGRAP